MKSSPHPVNVIPDESPLHPDSLARRQLLLAGLGAVSGLSLASCGGGGDAGRSESMVQQAGPTARALAEEVVTGKRLSIQQRRVYAPDGTQVFLHGVNLKDNLDNKGNASPSMLESSEAQDIARVLRCNFVRLRISLEGANIDTSRASGMSEALEQAIFGAWSLLSAERVWMLFEMRTDDATANNKKLYTLGSDTFESYAKTWAWIAKEYASRDYVAGYGLLAEPSPDRTTLADPVDALIGFYAALMDRIREHDKVTPFFIGPAYNYDTMGYRYAQYYTDPRFDAYKAPNLQRLAYEVNCLMPKPWIQDGSAPYDTPNVPMNWPRARVDDFSPLQAIEPGEPYQHPQDDERIFAVRRQEEANYPLTLAVNFPAWYLSFAQAFAEEHKVPIVVDQFGASTLVNKATRPDQQLYYENAVINAAEAAGMGWCRWIYSGSPVDRAIAGEGNERVHEFYVEIGRTRPGP